MPRLFFALNPPPTLRAAMAEFTEAVLPRRARAVPAANLHMTLVFLGQVDEGAARALVATDPSPLPAPCTLHLDRCGCWRRSGVLFLAPEAAPPELGQLVSVLARLAEAAGLELEAREWRPHVTLARRVRRVPRSLPPAGFTWPVRDFALMASHQEDGGVRYEPLRSWSLERGSG